MKSNVISVLLVALLAVTVTDRALAGEPLANYAGLIRSQVNPEQVSLDLTDYLPVYRFDVGAYGAFDVIMYEGRTPVTASNFRNYADRGDYDGTFFHRSVVSGIGIVQAGGFNLVDEDLPFITKAEVLAGDFSFGNLGYVSSDDPIRNEPGISNTQGTIALAKTSAGLNTGTTQWYFNTTDNPGLDNYAVDPNTGITTGAYTVFGEVLYDGMDVVGGGGIAGLPRWNITGPDTLFGTVPLSDTFQFSDPAILAEHMVIIDSISQVTGQTYAVIGNTNPTLVTETLLGTSLTLDITADMAGQAEVTIRVTDAADPSGRWFDAVLRVAVAPSLETIGDNWGYSSVGWDGGDLDGDGLVGLGDLTYWGTYYGDSEVPTPTPEPATCVLLGIGGLVSLARRRR